MRGLRVLVMVVVAAAFSAGCGGKDPPAGDASPVPDAMVLPDAGSNPLARGHSGSGNVAGGVKAQSANFKLLGTMGKGDGTASSPNFEHRGGVLGGTQP